ncbi:MAG: hypothetical protein WB780_09385, partial [Candidatus Acidiferrales bacterium]
MIFHQFSSQFGVQENPRAREGSGGSNSERKIFPTHGLRGTGVYAVSGAASFPDRGPIDPFIDIYKKTAGKLESETFSDLTE